MITKNNEKNVLSPHYLLFNHFSLTKMHTGNKPVPSLLLASTPHITNTNRRLGKGEPALCISLTQYMYDCDTHLSGISVMLQKETLTCFSDVSLHTESGNLFSSLLCDRFNTSRLISVRMLYTMT